MDDIADETEGFKNKTIDTMEKFIDKFNEWMNDVDEEEDDN
jgi:hypothetical protein